MKSLIEKYLKAASDPVGIKEVLLHLREELDEWILCVEPVANLVFDLIEEGKVELVSAKGEPGRFRWVNQ